MVDYMNNGKLGNMKHLQRSVWHGNVPCLFLLFLLLVPFFNIQGETFNSMTSEKRDETIQQDIESIDYVEGYDVSLALDSVDKPHVSYAGTNCLRYAKKTDTGWKTKTVESSDSSMGKENSLAIDSSDNPHVSYEGNSEDSIFIVKYAKRLNNTWNTETVEERDSVCPCLALDSSDKSHISFMDYENLLLKYATWTGEKWNIQTIDPTRGAGLYSSLVLDSGDDAHILYLKPIKNNEVIKYATWTGDMWAIEKIDEGTKIGFFNKIVLDSADKPHIMYRKENTIKYGKLIENNWDIETIDALDINENRYIEDLALDSMDRPYIIYQDKNLDINIAKKIDNEWIIKTVANCNVNGSRIKIDTDDFLHVTYIDDDASCLKYVKMKITDEKEDPNKPLDVIGTLQKGSIDLSWSAPSYNGGSAITDFNVYRGTNSTNIGFLASVPAQETYYQDQDVYDNHTYFYYVTAVNAIGESKPSDIVSVTYIEEPPDIDGDGVVDANDAFPDDPSASIDSDKDGHPDGWNPGETVDNSTTGLTLDAFPNDSDEWNL